MRLFSRVFISTLGFGVFIALLLPELKLPWLRQFDTGFQEMIALHHLDNGILENRFSPVIATIDGEKIYHTAHPPLLHLVYAFAYKFSGTNAEWVTRVLSLFFYLGSVIFWIIFFTRREERFLVFLFSLFIPLGFRLCLTTNYEPLCLFLVSLWVGLFFEAKRRESKILFRLSYLFFFISLFSDWVSYLAVVSVLLNNFRDGVYRRRLFFMLLLEISVFLALVFYQFRLSGEFVFFQHSVVRSNPLVIFDFNSYREFYNHFLELAGIGVLGLTLLSLLSFFLLRKKEAEKEGIKFFGIFILLFYLSAFQLLSRHYVHLLYLVPFLVLLLSRFARRFPSQELGLCFLILFFFPYDLQGIWKRDLTGYYLSQKIKDFRDIKTAFSSQAIGFFYYYDKIETIVPLNQKAREAFEKFEFDLVVMDEQNKEVRYIRDIFKDKEKDYERIFSFADQSIYIRKELGKKEKYLGAFVAPKNWGRNWYEPYSEVIMDGDELVYGIKEHPGRRGISSFRVELDDDFLVLKFKPAIVHKKGIMAKSDGVWFYIISDSNERNKNIGYARYVKEKDRLKEVEIKIEQAKTLCLFTNAGPFNNFAFDDAYWLDAELFRGN